MSEAIVTKIAEAAWKVLNFDNDPHDGQPHNTANWDALTKAIRAAVNGGDSRG